MMEFYKLRRFMLLNRIRLSDLKSDDKFEIWIQSNSKSDIEIGFRLKDDVKIQFQIDQFLIDFPLILNIFD